jgi:Tfp pilus assembly protein PilN
MARPFVRANMDGRREVEVHVLMLTLMIALVVCVLLLVAFGLFTVSPFAHRVDRLHGPGLR